MRGEKLRKKTVVIVSALLVGTFLLDIATPLGIASWLGYYFAVLVSFRNFVKKYLIGISAASSLLIVAGIFLSPLGVHLDVALANRMAAIVSLWLMTRLLIRIKVMSGLLPICAWCKKVRGDRGYWVEVETYISDRSHADFTHGICPECYKKFSEEIDK